MKREFGTGHITKRGYLKHKRSGKGKFAHVEIAERALGRRLPPGAVVHHADGDKLNNENLVICPNQAYHLLLHQRMDAKAACGNPEWRKCYLCKQYDDPARLKIAGTTVFHRLCVNAYHRKRYRASHPQRK